MGISLSARSQVHVARKVWHCVMGLGVVFVLAMPSMDREKSMILLGGALALCMVIEVARLRSRPFNDWTMRRWGVLMRMGEEERFTGVPYYLAAALLVVSVFPESIAILSLLFLAFADPLASLFGILFGHLSVKFKNGKSLIGTAAAFVMCALCTAVYLSKSQGISGFHLVGVSLVAGVIGATAEAVPAPLDDNFTMPVLSACGLWILGIGV